MGVLNIPQYQSPNQSSGASGVMSSLISLLGMKMERDSEDNRKSQERRQTEEKDVKNRKVLGTSLAEILGVPETLPAQEDTSIPETIRRPADQLDPILNPKVKSMQELPSEVSGDAIKNLYSEEAKAKFKEPKALSLEESFVRGKLTPEEDEKYLTGRQTLMPVTTMKDGKPVLSAVGSKTGKMNALGEAKPIAINLNAPSASEIQNAAWKVANGEMTINEIPARSTARMAVINELSTNPAYKDVNLAQSKANIKKMQDPALIRSNSLIAAIDAPLKSFEASFERLNNTGILPANATANWFAKNIGDPRIAEVNTYRNELVREIQRALTNTGAIAQQGVQQQLDILDSSYSLPQIKASIAAIQEILNARIATQTSPIFPGSKPSYDPRTQSGVAPQEDQGGSSIIQNLNAKYPGLNLR